MKTTIKPSNVILNQPKLDLKHDFFKDFLSDNSLFNSYYFRLYYNFKDSIVILDLNKSGKFWVSNMVSSYQTFKTDFKAITENFEVVVYLGSMDSRLEYIAAQREGHDKLKSFISDLAKKHRFTEIEPYYLQGKNPKTFETFFIDSEKIDESIERQKETLKIKKFLQGLKNGKLEARPRLKFNDKKSLENLDLKIDSYHFFRSILNMEQKEQDKLLSYIKSLSSPDLTRPIELNALYNWTSKHITLNLLRKLEARGLVFNQDNAFYKKLTLVEVFNELGGQDE